MKLISIICCYVLLATAFYACKKDEMADTELAFNCLSPDEDCHVLRVDSHAIAENFALYPLHIWLSVDPSVLHPSQLVGDRVRVYRDGNYMHTRPAGDYHFIDYGYTQGAAHSYTFSLLVTGGNWTKQTDPLVIQF
jgi:hypothetical protein